MVANLTDPVSGKTTLEQVLESNKDTELQILIEMVSLVKLNVKSKQGTPNPYPDCVKYTSMLVVVNRGYDDSTNTQHLVEGKVVDFGYEPRQWGTVDGPLIRYNGHVYLNSIVLTADEPTYHHAGKQLDPAVLIPFQRKSTNVPTQRVDNEIIVCTILCTDVMNFAIVS